MQIKTKIFKTSFLILLATISIIVSIQINQYYINIIGNTSKIVTPDNINIVRENIKANDVISLKGTINSLTLVYNKNMYFAGLKEYGNSLIVEFSPDKLNYDFTEFKGRDIDLLTLNSNQSLIDRLNSPIDTNLLVSQGFLKPSDTNIISDVKKISTSNFSTKSLLLIDGTYIDKKLLVYNTIVFPIVLFVILIIVFRRLIYK